MASEYSELCYIKVNLVITLSNAGCSSACFITQ